MGGCRMKLTITQAFESDPELQKKLSQLPELCRNTAKLLKSDQRGEVYYLPDETHSLAIKRFPPIWKPVERIKRRLIKRRLPGMIWDRWCRARQSGLPVAEPVALLQPQGTLGEAYIATRWVNGTPINAWLSDRELTEQARMNTYQAVLKLLSKLHAVRMTHGDLRSRNILVENGHPILIDLDGIRQHSTPWMFNRRFAKDRRNLITSLKEANLDTLWLQSTPPG